MQTTYTHDADETQDTYDSDPALERENTLYHELSAYPTFQLELQAIQEDAYGLMLSSPMLSHQNCICKTKSSGGSRLESVVVRVLSSSYVMELELLVAACLALYEDVTLADRSLLLALWRKEPLADAFPPRLLYRFQYFKNEFALHAAGIPTSPQVVGDKLRRGA